jgi:hypothetical protein
LVPAGAVAVLSNVAPYVTLSGSAAPAPAAIPSLSEWAQLMLGLIVLTMLGWQWRKQQN